MAREHNLVGGKWGKPRISANQRGGAPSGAHILGEKWGEVTLLGRGEGVSIYNGPKDRDGHKDVNRGKIGNITSGRKLSPRTFKGKAKGFMGTQALYTEGEEKGWNTYS